MAAIDDLNIALSGLATATDAAIAKIAVQKSRIDALEAASPDAAIAAATTAVAEATAKLTAAAA